MKRITILLLSLFFFAISVFSSPLVFKATKEIKNASISNFAELISFNAIKYKQVRIALFRSNIESQKKEQVNGFQVFAIEGNEEFFISWFDGYSAVIDVPPSQVKLKVADNGFYKIFVWASQ